MSILLQPSISKRQISILLPYKITGDDIHVFLQKRSSTAEVLPNYFGFWGGGAENRETPDEALRREIKEEMGLVIDMKSVSLFNRYEFLRSVKFIYTFVPHEGWENKIVIGEGDYGKWFTAKEAMNREDIILEDKVILNDLERKLFGKPIR